MSSEPVDPAREPGAADTDPGTGAAGTPASATPTADAPATAVDTSAGSGEAPAPGGTTADSPAESVPPAAPTDSAPPGAPTDGDGRPPGRGLGPLGYVLAALGGIAVAVAALALSGSLAIGGSTPEPSPSPDPSPTPAAFVDGRALGDPNAPVTIEIWADFQCPFCGLQARGVEPSIERSFAADGRARVVYRDFAFLGQESFDAAVAARCAGRQDAFWYYHDLLFSSQQGENQGAFARERLVALAEFAALDTAAFTACLGDVAVLKEVQDETAQGGEVGVTSTPVLRIEGPGGLQVITGLRPLSEVEAAVERAEQPLPSASPGPSASPSGSVDSPGASSASPAPTAEASPSP